jgi:regulator of sigma E protease
MTLLAINWSEAGVKAAQFIFSFSIIVVLHELGHFLPAKWFKCRVEKFYLFFNPWFSLVKKKVGETEYGLGWVPFGGYVKISGMIDESMDKDAMKQPPKPYEFRSKPAWQRLIIMIGGVTVNLLLGFFLYAMIMWYYGDSYIPTNGLKYGISTDSLGKSIGLRSGDRIISLDGKQVEKLRRIPIEVIIKGAKSIQVERDGQKLNIPIPEDFASNLIRYKGIRFIDVRFPFEGLDSIASGSVAEKAGLMKNDRILAVNGISTPFYDIFQGEVPRNRNKEITLDIVRGADSLTKKVFIPAEGTLGVYPKTPTDTPANIKTVNYSFAGAIPAGLNTSIQTLQDNWLQLKLLFSKKVKTSDSLGSVISIGKMYPGEWDWQQVWSLTAFFSLVLALMNILPIPALDGGHAMFTLYEMISGRKPSDKFIEYAQMVGMILLLGVTAYALGLDIFRLFK